MHALKNDIRKIGRLKKRSDFLRIHGGGRKWVSGSMIVQVLENNLEDARFGLTVTKKVSKNAVVRNRIKRRLRAACCEILPLNAESGHDYIFIGRAATENVPYETLLKDMKWCLKRLDCLNIN